MLLFLRDFLFSEGSVCNGVIDAFITFTIQMNWEKLPTFYEDSGEFFELQLLM